MSCAKAIAAAVYSGRDNVISVALYADGVLLTDLTAVTRVTVKLDATTTIDSDTASAGAIVWTLTKAYRGQTINDLRLKLGNEGVALGTYTGVVVSLFSPTYPNGLAMENDIELTFK